MSRSYEESAVKRRASWSPEVQAFAVQAGKYFANERRNITKPIGRAYIGGVVVTIELEDEVYFVLINRPDEEHVIVHSRSPRERPARRKFAEEVTELEQQFEAQGRRWDR